MDEEVFEKAKSDYEIKSMLDNYLKQTKSFESTVEKSKIWLESHGSIRNDIDKAFGGLNQLSFAIPIFGGSGDEFKTIQPWHHIFFEADQDLDSAILLMMMGFYKDSFRSLRSFLELNIFALYNFVNEDKVYFQKWLNGKDHTPGVSEMLQKLSEKSLDIKILDEKLDWNKEVKSLYKDLSGFMHTQGALHTHTSLRNSNTTSFSETGIRTGTELLLRVIRLTAMGFAVNFPMSFHALPLFEKFAFSPPAGGFLDNDQVESVKSIFSNEVSKKVSAICLANEDANSLADGVRSMHDQTEEEILESLKRTLKSDEFKNSREDIIMMIKDGQYDKAFVMVIATQRAVIRAINGILFNPFYEARKGNS
jgi:hypothetical protein